MKCFGTGGSKKIRSAVPVSPQVFCMVGIIQNARATYLARATAAVWHGTENAIEVTRITMLCFARHIYEVHFPHSFFFIILVRDHFNEYVGVVRVQAMFFGVNRLLCPF